jgi:hypothetical protein
MAASVNGNVKAYRLYGAGQDAAPAKGFFHAAVCLNVADGLFT